MNAERIEQLRKENSWAIEECLVEIERIQAELVATRKLFMRWGDCDPECSSQNGEDVDCDCGWNPVALALASNLSLSAIGAEAKEPANPDLVEVTEFFDKSTGEHWVDVDGMRYPMRPVAAPAAERCTDCGCLVQP